MPKVNYETFTRYLKDKELFIFGFDGTIANTEEYQWEACNILLAKENVTLKREHIYKYIGHTELKIYEMIKEDFGIEFDNEQFFKERFDVYVKLTKENNLQPFPYIRRLIKDFKDIEFVILSSQRVHVIDMYLKKWGIDTEFTKIISVSDHQISKHEALKDTEKYYGYSSDVSVLFEDTNRVLQIGQAEKIFSVGIEHMYNVGLLTDCDVVIEGAK